MQLEIDVLSVGNADAQVLRIFDGTWEHVTVIDGGNPKDGDLVVDFVRRYSTRGVVDIVLSTHPDQDHIGGLFKVVEELPVMDKVLVHDPRPYLEAERTLRTLNKWGSYAEALRKEESSLQLSLDFLDLLEERRIRWKQPFSDSPERPHPFLTICGPSSDFYVRQLSRWKDPIELLIDSFMKEKSASEVLDEKDDESPINQTSVISSLEWLGGRKYLFTADAGVAALRHAAARADLSNLHYLQVPHHGSRRNLDSFLVRHFSPTVSVISADGDRKHPSRAVVDALAKVGSHVYSTHNNGHLLITDPPGSRPGYGPVEPLKTPASVAA